MDRFGHLVSLLGGFTLLATAAGPVRAQSWVDQTACTTVNWEGVWFTSPQNGWVVGQGYAVRITDGNTWTPVYFANPYLNDVTFRDLGSY